MEEFDWDSYCWIRKRIEPPPAVQHVRVRVLAARVCHRLCALVGDAGRFRSIPIGH